MARKRRRLSSGADVVAVDARADTMVDAGIAEYFPAACEHMFGPLPVPDSATRTGDGEDSGAFPHNVSFRTADWVKEEIVEDAGGYDIVTA